MKKIMVGMGFSMAQDNQARRQLGCRLRLLLVLVDGWMKMIQSSHYRRLLQVNEFNGILTLLLLFIQLGKFICFLFLFFL